jgi:uncharacterized protein (TIGR04255 family)
VEVFMAKTSRHLERAPISEALIDIRVRPREGVELGAVQELVKSIDGYQSQGPIITLQTRWMFSEQHGVQEQSESREIGIRLQSDQKYVLQLRTDGLTLSRLEPYETWEKLVTEGKRLWEIYRRSLEPDMVMRVATRYINLLKLPMSQGGQFEEYLTKPPQVPDGLPQAVQGFMQRVALWKPEIDARANVIQLLQDGPVPADHVPIVIDIDVYKQVELHPESDLWKLLGDLRVFKNEIFFAHLTDRAVGLFE